MNTDLIYAVSLLVIIVVVALGIGGISLYDEIKTAINKRKKDVISEEINLF